MRDEAAIRADAADERPFSNGTEFEIFADRYCYRCVHDNPETEKYCPILGVALIGNDGEPAWPQEWTRKYVKFGARIPGTSCVEVSQTTADDPDGCEFVDTCTEFEERRDGDDDPAPEPDPPPECHGQLDIIDAYVDTAVDELSRAPESATA